MISTSSGKTWNLKRVLESPGKSWNFDEILERSWKVFVVKSLREISKSTPVFFRLPLYVEYSISMTNCYDFYSGTLDAVMSIFSAHQLVTIFKYTNLQLRA